MHHDIQLFAEYAVTPFVGVWIETKLSYILNLDTFVTPFVGGWIESFWDCRKRNKKASHPSWVCGLKLVGVQRDGHSVSVTPFVGVWIETPSAEMD